MQGVKVENIILLYKEGSWKSKKIVLSLNSVTYTILCNYCTICDIIGK